MQEERVKATYGVQTDENASFPIATWSLHQLEWISAEKMKISSPPFSPRQYSRYKYGSRLAAAAYGKALGEAFLQHFPDLARSPRLLLTSSAYKVVPPSALCIAHAFGEALNQRRRIEGRKAIRLVKMERTTLYPGDYGAFSAAQRRHLMQNNHHQIDHSMLAGADLVVIDDIKVTGEHQACVERHMKPIALSSLMFLYVLSCVNAGDATADPQIEDRLNHAQVKNLMDLASCVRSPDFVFNARVCKYLLNPAHRATFPTFLAQMPDSLLWSLSQGIRGDGYDFMEVYRESVEIIFTVMHQRGLLPDLTIL